jgi:hypothetical protein
MVSLRAKLGNCQRAEVGASGSRGKSGPVGSDFFAHRVMNQVGGPAFMRMPRFFFDLRYDSEPWSADESGGTICESRQAARVEAVTLVAEIAKDEASRHRKIAVSVRDRSSPEPLVTVTLSVDLEPPD